MTGPRIAFFLALLLCMFLPASAQAASFDCTKAAHPLEKLVCATPALSTLDEKLASVYREKRVMLLAKSALRDSQRAWQRKMRALCERGCKPGDVEAAYGNRLANLNELDGEIWMANYKTGDAIDLSISHFPQMDGHDDFAFSLTRYLLDDPEEKRLCLLDAPEGGERPFARMLDAARARYTDGKGCRLDFRFQREADGNVPSIDITASPQCKRYCEDKRYTLGDTNFILSDLPLPEE